MSGNIRTVTDADFALVVQASDKPVLVDFWAAWCAPCVQIAPVLEQLADEHGDVLVFASMDVDRNPVTPTAYRVRGMPTMIVFHEGEPVASIVGARSKSALVRELATFLHAQSPEQQ